MRERDTEREGEVWGFVKQLKLIGLPGAEVRVKWGGSSSLRNVFKAHRRLYHSTLGLRVITKKKVGGEGPRR